MTAMLRWTPPVRGKHQRSVEIKEQMILHTRFLCVWVLRGPRTPEAVLRRRVAGAAKKLWKRGCRQAVLPEDFPYSDQLGQLRPVSALPLRQALAADWIRWALIRQGTAAAGARVGHGGGDGVHAAKSSWSSGTRGVGPLGRGLARALGQPSRRRGNLKKHFPDK